MSANAPTPRLRPWEWGQSVLLGGNLAWTTLCLGGYRTETMVLSWALTAAMLVLHFGGIAAGWDDAPRFHPAGWWVIPFLVYAATNVAWVTPVPWIGWRDYFGWAQMAAVFWVMLNGIRSRGPRLLVGAVLLVLGVVAVLLACHQRFQNPRWLMLGFTQAEQFVGRASGPFGIPNTLAGLLLLLLPVSAVLAVRRHASATERVLFAWLTAVFGVGLFLTISRGAWIALALALIVWPISVAGWSVRRRLAVAIAALVLIAAGGAAVFATAPKARERFVQLVSEMGERTRPVMWRAAWRLFLDRPVVGTGAGSYNVLFERHRPATEQGEPVWAHNDYLNTLSDHGLVGFALSFGVAGFVVWRFRRRLPVPPGTREAGAGGRRRLFEDPAVVRAIGIGLLAFSLQLFVDFHFKIPALAMAFATVAGIWIASDRAEPAPARRWVPRRALAAVAAIAVALVTVGGIVPRLRAEAWRNDLRRQLDGLATREVSSADKLALAEHARDRFTAALALDPANAQAWADRAYAQAIIAHEKPENEATLGPLAEGDARRALAISRVVPEFWLRLGVALDMQRRWVDAGDAFSEALQLAPASAPTWFYQAYHLALNPVTLPLARSAVATCLRLDPSNRDADTLRRHLAQAP